MIPYPRQAQRGVTLVEVLVTLVILAVGLLGLVALQARVQVLQAESYQRSQALLLLKDIAGRIANNRNDAANYVTGTAEPLGGGAECPDPGATRAEADLAQWCNALNGAGEVLGGSNVGAMLGGRGCIENPGPGEFLVTVVWQGLAPLPAPVAEPDDVALDCGSGAYDGEEGDPCSGDACRRVVSTVVIVPALTS